MEQSERSRRGEERVEQERETEHISRLEYYQAEQAIDKTNPC
jgi:hypothetical protein